MATTTPEPLLPGHDVRLEPIYEAYVSALGDSDNADNTMDCSYYEGLVDAYYDVLVTLGGIAPEAEEEEVGTMP